MKQLKLCVLNRMNTNLYICTTRCVNGLKLAQYSVLEKLLEMGLRETIQSY